MPYDAEREQRFSGAQAALEGFFSQVGAAEAISFDSWCEERADIAAELRQLYSFCSPFLVAAPSRGMPAAVDLPVPESMLLERLSLGSNRYGDYTIEGVLDRGAMGAILAVRDQVLRRDLAMKVVLGPEHVEPRRLSRFLEEAQITSQLDHPGVVPVHELGIDPSGRAYFTMKRVRGRKLQEIFELVAAGDAGWNQTRALGVLLRVCEAIACAHSRGVIHRDLKPANVMVGDFGEVYVMDWGLARVLGKVESGVSPVRTEMETDRSAQRDATTESAFGTKDGDLIGTPVYMAPEQAAGKLAEIGTHSDVYAVGSMLYHLLARRPPYSNLWGESAPREVLMRVLDAKPEPLRLLAPSAPADLIAICEKAMAREWRTRYRDMSELSADLAAFLEGRVVPAYESGALAEARKWILRNKELAASLAGAIVILVVGLIASSIQHARAVENARVAAIHERQAKEEAAAALVAREAETHQRELVVQRERELSRVAEFQASMLSSVDPHAMGAVIYGKLRAQIGRARAPEGSEAESVQARVRAFDELAGDANFTNLARDVVDSTFMSPASKAIEREFADQPMVEASLRHSIGRAYAELGSYEEARHQLERALELRRAALGNDHEDTLITISALGSLLEQQGNLAEAESYALEALESRRRVLGDEHPSTLTSMNNLAILFAGQAKFAEAEVLLQAVLETRRRILGDEHRDTLHAMSNLGSMLHEQGRLDEAESLYRPALEAARRVMGGSDPWTLLLTNSLGVLLQDGGKYYEAETYYHEALKMRRHTLGDEHPHTLVTIYSLGNLLHTRGQLDEAEPLYREALDARRRILGNEHPHTLLTIDSMAGLMRAQGKSVESEALSLEAVAGYRRVLGDDHPQTIHSILGLANLLNGSGRREEAEGFYREVLETRRRTLGGGDPLTLNALRTLAFSLEEQGRLLDTEPIWRECFETTRGVLGSDHPDTLEYGLFLAGALQFLGSQDEADSLYGELAEVIQRVLGEDHVGRISLASYSGVLRAQQGRLDEAEECFRDALDRSTRVLGEDNQRTLWASVRMESLLLVRGRWDEAELATRDTLDDCRRVLGERHPATVMSVLNLGYLLLVRGRVKDAQLHVDEGAAGVERLLAEWPPDMLPAILAARVLPTDSPNLDASQSIARRWREALMALQAGSLSTR